MPETYSPDEILAAARLVSDCSTATLRENCILQIRRNKMLRGELVPAIARLLGIPNETRIYEWKN